EQGPMLAALGKTAARVIAQKLGGQKGTPSGRPSVPSVELVRTAAAPSAELVAAYVKHVGGDPKAYRGAVPPHFFPQWVMPVASETVAAARADRRGARPGRSRACRSRRARSSARASRWTQGSRSRSSRATSTPSTGSLRRPRPRDFAT